MKKLVIKQAIVGVTTILFLLLAACTNPASDPTPVAAINTPAATITPSVTPTLTAVPTATSTPTPTNTPTPTPTPTATAMPINVNSDLRGLQVSDPVPSGNASCGVVDLFDFPIDPPDAAHVSRGGSDFGIFRNRYDKYHAGEDWSGPSGRPNLGTPVYSIGHGLVTYAQPLGWGRDQGVVIIQHTFADGRKILSFYGHLDPDSVVLDPGSCVRRGEQVGLIGQPRGFPHLHFEVRTQAPYETLTGYWWEDPTKQGWLWPSQQIWAARVGAIPGVSWARPFATRDSRPIGPIDDNDYLLLEDRQLLRLDMSNGRSNPIDFGLAKLDDALRHEVSDLLFLADINDTLAAYSLPDLVLQWQITLPLNIATQLLPLPDGGVVVATRNSLTAVSTTGELLWTESLESRPLDWQLSAEALYLTTDGNDGRLWQVQPDHAEPIVDLGGKLALHGDTLWLYNRLGLYQIDLGSEAASANLVYPLPTSALDRSDLLALPDGGLLLAHTDVFDRRLIQFGNDGQVLWQRSYAGEIEGKVTLHLLNDQPYLAASIGSSTNGRFNIYALNQNQNTLSILFVGGSRTPITSDMWITAVSDIQLLVNVGGGPLALFDPAAESVTSDQ